MSEPTQQDQKVRSAYEQVEVRDNPAAHRFEVEAGGKLAIARYRLAPGTITFVHTRVPQELRGHGIATRMIVAALASARRRRLQVVPECPLFAAYMRSHAEVQDLLAPPGKALLGL